MPLLKYTLNTTDLPKLSFENACQKYKLNLRIQNTKEGINVRKIAVDLHF